MTNPNEPISALPPNVAISDVFGGLTKREHMAIEFTKALLNGKNEQQLYLPVRNKIITEALLITDELIKQLNEPKP